VDGGPWHRGGSGGVHQAQGGQRALQLKQMRAFLLMRRCPEPIEHGQREIAKARASIDEQNLAQDPGKGLAFVGVLIAPAAEHGRQPIHGRPDSGRPKDLFGERQPLVVAQRQEIRKAVKQVGEGDEVVAHLAIDPRRMRRLEGGLRGPQDADPGHG
jgi:hypothetical protein